MTLNRRTFLALGAPLAATPLILAGHARAQTTGPAVRSLPFPPAGADGWISLMNGRNLDGLYTMLQRSGKGVAETKGMVTFENGMLHIMGNQVTEETAESGYIATKQEFENYRVRVEYKWGVKRFLPRLEAKRDNGLLYHLVGEDRVWPTCVECQIQEGDVCDYFMLGGTRGSQGGNRGGGAGRGGTAAATAGGAASAAGTPANRGAGAAAASGPPAGAAPAVTGTGRAGATPVEPTSGRKLRDQAGDFEIKDGWNVVEVVVQGDRSSHLLNGIALNNSSNLQQPDPQNAGQFIPLTRGKIAIEIEFAEIWYRRFEIKPLA